GMEVNSPSSWVPPTTSTSPSASVTQEGYQRRQFMLDTSSQGLRNPLGGGSNSDPLSAGSNLDGSKMAALFSPKKLRYLWPPTNNTRPSGRNAWPLQKRL